MLLHLNLFSAGGPLPGAPGSLLMKPATSPRYEPDLVQLQRATRAQAASEQAGQAAPKQARLLYKSTPLPKYLFPKGEARRTDMAQWAKKEQAEGGGLQPDVKHLPECAQDFLRGRIAADPADIRLYDGGGGIPNWVGSHVTYGNDIHLADGTFQRRAEPAMRDKFHEIGHVDQNARMDLNSFDHFAAYLPFLGHDKSPLEQDAKQTFQQKMYNQYIAAGLDKTCRF